MRHWIAVVKIEDEDSHTIHEITDALTSLGDAPKGIRYTYELYEVDKGEQHHGIKEIV